MDIKLLLRILFLIRKGNLIMERYNDIFEYFIYCYFNHSMDYDELSNLADQYLTCENNFYITSMKKRVEELYKLKDAKYIKTLIWDYGERNLSVEKSEELIELLYHKFSSEVCYVHSRNV
jgi:hypothetical protein